ncbi:MAG: DUF1178 family protein [Rhodobacteraceae bacterium]|nr:DUF1178 family protein [Paracoccaceae bacterium]
MIRYTLKCNNDHGFESWFASAAACDSLMASGRVSCIHCGSTEVTKSLMAPAVNHGTEKAAEPAAAVPARPLSTAANPVEAALAALRREVEANSEYVGLDFVTEARAIHEGAAPERAIFGEARLDEARKLLEDGVPVAPLPFLSPRRAN